MRIILIFIALALLFAVPFVVWGSAFEGWLDGEGAVTWLRSSGSWAWILAVLLLAADLVLPIPATAVLAALGVVYGPLLGGIIGGAGSVLSGALAYGACRLAGSRAALFLAGERDLARGRRFFECSGGWAVVLSRWMPLLPEVVACLAGLMEMKPTRFFAALLCGSLPMAFCYAFAGHLGADQPLVVLAASALVPLVVWALLARTVLRRGKSSAE